MEAYSNLFSWWIGSITFNILFVIFASIYLYRRRKQPKIPLTIGRAKRWVKDFYFVWILLSLLILYIVSISEGSQGYYLFAGGNVVVEIALIMYVIGEGRASQESIS